MSRTPLAPDFHLREVLLQASGHDVVEERRRIYGRGMSPLDAIRKPGTMTFPEWHDQKPFEVLDISPVVFFPIQWTKRRGRYSRFLSPKAFCTVVRARPSL